MDDHKEEAVLTETEIEIVKNFREKLISVQKELPPEYVKVIRDNFWDLV